MAIYFIGGSPCSGKSTVAQALAEKWGLQYFKVDDHLERYMKMAAADGKACCAKVVDYSADQIWLREPAIQCDEELRIYEEIFEYILADLRNLEDANGIITEGASYLPALIRKAQIPAERYLSITPTKEFQLFHYRQREWVPYVLADCSDKELAFMNWMDRDALFALEVQRQCRRLGYTSMINDGMQSAEQMTAAVQAHFGL